ncbi:hypothetical protein RR48_13290 [Papilio machaon]|uniref:Uncharacterized protein n=1 Tax=Papilio machaon TaxID=76193 RepID=A0A194R1D4_PAPMA|nr:hypothetical protein RR48_13290 [Papilio machaon]
MIGINNDNRQNQATSVLRNHQRFNHQHGIKNLRNSCKPLATPVDVAAIYLVLIICIFQEVELKTMRVPRQLTSDVQSTVSNNLTAIDDSVVENLGQILEILNNNTQSCPTCSGNAKS